MVFAKNDDQFNQLKKEMIDKAKGLGYDDVVAFNKKQNEEAFTYRK
jgi:putative aldouronate transport system substrate-binding protein